MYTWFILNFNPAIIEVSGDTAINSYGAEVDL